MVVSKIHPGLQEYGLIDRRVIFTINSAFNDVGFTLTPDSMVSFQRAVWPLMLFSFLIVIGNTGFPCLLRLIIWVMKKVVPAGSSIEAVCHSTSAKYFYMALTSTPSHWDIF